jgi:predicted XRE-type DNA-binding protein
VVVKRGRKAAARARQQTQTIPKEPLAREIRRLIEERGLSQVDAAVVVHDAASQLSLLLSGKLRGFSTDRLVRTLLHLGREVELVVRPAAAGRKRRQATVTIATTPSGRGGRRTAR